MTRPFLAPGCFGSALAAQVQSVTCQECRYAVDCFAQVNANEPEFKAHLTRKLTARDMLDGLDRLIRKVRAFRTATVKQPTAEKSGNKRSDKMLERYKSQNIDLTALLRGVNPFSPERHTLHFHMAAFVMAGEPFKPKDVAEYVQRVWPDCDLTTGSLKSEVARFASALVAAGVLERLGTYILCLAH